MIPDEEYFGNTDTESDTESESESESEWSDEESDSESNDMIVDEFIHDLWRVYYKNFCVAKDDNGDKYNTSSLANLIVMDIYDYNRKSLSFNTQVKEKLNEEFSIYVHDRPCRKNVILYYFDMMVGANYDGRTESETRFEYTEVLMDIMYKYLLVRDIYCPYDIKPSNNIILYDYVEYHMDKMYNSRNYGRASALGNSRIRDNPSYDSDAFLGKIDKGVVKIQSVWRGYDCRWKNPFLLINN